MSVNRLPPSLSLTSALALVVVLAVGCQREKNPEPIVFSAPSLARVLASLAPDARYKFAPSGQLAKQLRKGARADVYAAPVPDLLALHRQGVVDRPRLLCSDHLVVIVRRSNPARVRSLADLARDGVKIVLAATGEPAGDYARSALSRSQHGKAILANVVAVEEDVEGLIGKLARGEADAALVFRADVPRGQGR